MEAAKSLEQLIMMNNKQQKETIEDEINDLYEQLKKKDELIEECKLKIDRWQSTIFSLKEEQQQLLYDEIKDTQDEPDIMEDVVYQ